MTEPWDVPEAFNEMTGLQAARSIAQSCPDAMVREAFNQTIDELKRLEERQAVSEVSSSS